MQEKNKADELVLEKSVSVYDGNTRQREQVKSQCSDGQKGTEMGSNALIAATVDKPGECICCLDVADCAVSHPFSAVTENSCQKIGKFGNERMLQ